ncbi:MAG: FAD-binding oxidoreductase [Desulfobacterales bacterium]
MNRYPEFKPVTPAIVDALRAICGADAVVDGDEKLLEKYSHDEVPEKKYARRPEVIVMPKDADEVAGILKLANRERIPVTPRAAGSGLSGGAVPVFGGILLSVERMNRIIEIDPRNLMAVVEPGVVTRQIDQALRPHGLFFAGYPMSEEFCYIGGNVAENAGGGRAIKYGVTGRYIHGLDVVLPTGEKIFLGGKRVKDVTGYDLIHLMVGSEGTLGIFTRIVVRLLPRPQFRSAVLALFPDARTAIAVVPELMTAGGLIPTAVEFMDGFSFGEGARSLKLDLPLESTGAALLIEVDGSNEAAVRAEGQIVLEMVRRHGAIHEQFGGTEAEIEAIWAVRKRIPWALKQMTPYQSIEDIVVPIAEIPDLIAALVDIGRRFEVRIPVFGHAGDGNLHATPLKGEDQSVDQWEAMVPDLLAEIYRETARRGGTISGEHGIGHKRLKFMGQVMESAQLDVMRRIKAALDPNGILNPGKIFNP